MNELTFGEFLDRVNQLAGRIHRDAKVRIRLGSDISVPVGISRGRHGHFLEIRTKESGAAEPPPTTLEILALARTLREERPAVQHSIHDPDPYSVPVVSFDDWPAVLEDDGVNT